MRKKIKEFKEFKNNDSQLIIILLSLINIKL